MKSTFPPWQHLLEGMDPIMTDQQKEHVENEVDERAEFEKWHRAKFGWCSHLLTDEQTGNGTWYANADVENKWIGWQARAKLGQSYRGLDPTSETGQRNEIEGYAGEREK
jgi:hypothetical protein